MQGSQSDKVKHDLFNGIQQALTNTPYKVEADGPNLAVSLDLLDQQWWGMLSQRGVKTAMRHVISDVTLESYKITDQSSAIRWDGNTPTLAGAYSTVRGRSIQIGGQCSAGSTDGGGFSSHQNFTFNTEEGRNLIKQVASQMGLKEKMSAEVKGALIVAGIALVGALIALIVIFLL